MPSCMYQRLTKAFSVSSIIAAGLFSAVSAQTNTENFAQFRFNFNNPGARATGIGGAFISVADDATAAEANPAGLTAIIRPELSFEIKGIEFNQKVDNFSHTGTAASYTVDSKDFKASVVSPSFASIAVPLNRFTFSAFRYELVNFQSAFYTKGSFVTPLTDGSSFFPVKADNRLNVVNWGNAIAYKFNEHVSFGVSGGVSTVSMTSNLTRYLLEVFTPGTVASTATIDDNDFNFFLNAGILFKPRENLSIGAIYKRRPEFKLKHSFLVANTPNDSVTVKTINFNIPSSMGIGISYRPLDALTISFDAVRVRYSQLTDDFVLTVSEQYTQPGDFKVDDGMEYHGGAEYVLFFRSVAFVLRAGLYTEPDNRIRWVGNIHDSSNPDRIFARQTQAALFQGGDSYVHTTFGLGIVFSNSFQLDVAGNLSPVVKEVVGSFVVRM